MNYRLGGVYSVILMSLREGAPYADRVEEDGQVLIYEGHDVPRTSQTMNPKTVDQPHRTPGGKLTQNGLFYEAALRARQGVEKPEVVRVYEKIRIGVWVYNGVFELVDAWNESVDGRSVYKFKLRLGDVEEEAGNEDNQIPSIPRRMIPSAVKLEVWRRDHGRCVVCGSQENLHFDHIIPFSKGGSSSVASNIQILCAKHNISKRDRIQ